MIILCTYSPFIPLLFLCFFSCSWLKQNITPYMSAMQTHSFPNSSIFHSKHLQLNCGHGVPTPSIVGHRLPTRIWHSKKYPPSFWSFCQRPRIIRSAISRGKANQRQISKGGGAKKQKHKENLWSLDNELAERDSNKGAPKEPKKKKAGAAISNVGAKKRNVAQSRAIVSAPMPVETEKILQTQEPVIKPIWNTFVSSISGFWKGVGAAFSPMTAEMEPISLGKRNEYLYDCYILSKVEAVGSSSEGSNKRIHRTTNWVVANPLGEQGQGEIMIQDDLINAEKKMAADNVMENDTSIEASTEKTVTHSIKQKQDLSQYETTVLPSSNVMEEDFMDLEAGLVFFEDGSYSRGPLMLDVRGPGDDSRYYISPTYKIEQCLVRGCHKRLRLVHTIALKEGGAEVKLLRLAAYVEEWMGPSHLEYTSEADEKPLRPISEKKRISPEELVGSWKVFEISATAILDDLEEVSQSRPSFVYLCMETLKRSRLPEFPMYFGDADPLDFQDVTVLWLPGGITAYVDTKEGVLTVGCGWYSSDGTNLVMERDYGDDGKLLEVRSKSEVKRRWSDDSV